MTQRVKLYISVLVCCTSNWAFANNALICFPEDSQIPQYLRARNEKGEFLHPNLENRHLDLIQSIESFDYYGAKKSYGLDEPHEQIVIEPRSDETSSQYVERIARRFDWTIPVIAQKIREAQKTIPEKTIVRRDFRLGPVQDEIHRAEIDDRNCVVAPISKLSQVATGWVLEYDARLISIADRISPDKIRTLRAVTLLGDYMTYVSLAQGHKTREPVHSLIPFLIGVGFTAQNVFQAYTDLGFPGDKQFPAGDVRNFYPLKVIQETMDHLWNNEDSLYKTYEKQIIQEIVAKLPKLKGCEFYGRKEEGTAYTIFDCRYLMEKGYWFPPIAPALEMSETSKILASELIRKFSRYESELKRLLREAYRSQHKPEITKIPSVDKIQLQKIDEAIEEQIEDVLLTAHFVGKNEKRDREISTDLYGLRFDFEVPQI